MTPTEFQITLPPSVKVASPTLLKLTGPLVVVGANGSGKSRLATWLERQDPARTHRVSAQRALSFPDDLRSTTFQKAENNFLYGHESYTAAQAPNKFGQRWHDGISDRQLNDFQLLATVLFSEGAQISDAYFQKMGSAVPLERPPQRRLDAIKALWETVLPNRELVFGSHQVDVKLRNSPITYSPHEMSDGERVIFYLIGQCLSAPKNGIIIIDEPEIHLHRALQERLWDANEKARSDCLFVYVTHDLNFAASRNGQIVLLNEYVGSEKWDWDLVDGVEEIPEPRLLEILGSRSPILFVEGKHRSHDQRLYRTLYPSHLVVAFGGCADVIHLVASCRKLKVMGHASVNAVGLIDRDGRNAAEVLRLKGNGVLVLEWAEIENLLLCEEVIRFAAAPLAKNPDHSFDEIKKRILTSLSRDAERIIAEISGREIERLVKSWDWKQKTVCELENAFATQVMGVDSKGIVAGVAAEIKKIIAEGDYRAALRVYPNKAITTIAGDVLASTNYADFVLRVAETPEGKLLLEILRSLAPTLP